MFHGGAIGRASATDARVFAASVDRLDGGVHVSIGSAIMAPQIFEKALSAANNVRIAEGRATLAGHTWRSSIWRTAAAGIGPAASRPRRTRPTISASARPSTAWAARWITSVAIIGCFWRNC